jgi:hypothetical protein
LRISGQATQYNCGHKAEQTHSLILADWG